MVTSRRERRMAVRHAERAALPVPTDQDPAGQVALLPTVRAISGTQTSPETVPGVTEGECLDDEPEEIFDAPDDGDFYADAFEVLE
jgi:hypothetical protein